MDITLEAELKKKKKFELVDENKLELVKKTEDYFNSIHFGMTDFQIRKFILNPIEFPTPFSRYRQAKLELWKRFGSIMEDHFRYRELNAMIRLQEAKIKEFLKEDEENAEICTAKAELAQIKIDRYLYELGTMKKMVNEKITEMESFFAAVQEEEPKITGDEKEEDEKFWNEKMKKNESMFEQRYGVKAHE